MIEDRFVDVIDFTDIARYPDLKPYDHYAISGVLDERTRLWSDVILVSPDAMDHLKKCEVQDWQQLARDTGHVRYIPGLGNATVCEATEYFYNNAQPEHDNF